MREITRLGLVCIFVVLTTAQCDSGLQVDPPTAWIENVYVQELTCPMCEPAVTAQVHVGGDFAGMQLTILDARSDPDTLDLPLNPVKASWTNQPKIVYNLDNIRSSSDSLTFALTQNGDVVDYYTTRDVVR